MLAAEVGITAPSAYELAQLWANMALLWRGIAARIEAIRLAAIRTAEEAETPIELGDVVDAAISALMQIQAG